MPSSRFVGIAAVLTGLTAAGGVLGLVFAATQGRSIGAGPLAFAIAVTILLALVTWFLIDERWEGAALGLLYFGGRSIAFFAQLRAPELRDVIVIVTAVVCALALRECLAQRQVERPA